MKITIPDEDSVDFREAEMTDFAVCTSKYSFGEYDNKKPIHYNSFWKQKDNGQPHYVNSCHGDYLYKPDDWCESKRRGLRPALVKDNLGNYNLIGMKGDSTIIEYGYYPQTIVQNNKRIELERLYNSNNLQANGNFYTIDSSPKNSNPLDFKPLVLNEYSYEGERYVRLVIKEDSITLSDNKSYPAGTAVWFKVEPITWSYNNNNNNQTGEFIADKILLSNILFSRMGVYYSKSDFPKTEMYKYLNNYFDPEIHQEKTIEHDNEEIIDNPFLFDYDSVDEESIIRGAIEADIPIFLHGRTGEGKSSRVKQIDPDCQIIYLGNTRQPEEILGKTVYNSNEDRMIDKKPTWLEQLEEKCAREPDRIHILFFDELSHALDSIQGYVFNIIQDREVNGKWKLPKNVRIVAAGNEVEESYTANDLTEPLYHRFPAHVKIHTTTQKWLEWAQSHNIHPAVYTFIAYMSNNENSDILRSRYKDCVGKEHATNPRTWEKVSTVLKTTNMPRMLEAFIGSDLTDYFIAFARQKIITVDDVINKRYSTTDVKNMNSSRKYATIISLCSVDEEHLDTIRKFIKNLLGAEFLATFDSLWIGNDKKRLEIIQEKSMKEKRRFF